MAYLKLEYWNACDMGGLLYQLGYHNIIYLDVDAGKPVFETIEEGVEDGEKNFISTFTKMIKKYKLEMLLPEYQFDALNFASLHDYKYITLNNGETSRCLTFQVENKGWDDRGADVIVEVAFSVDYIIKENCCSSQLQLSDCVVCQKTIDGMVKKNGVEYNDPFNHSLLVNGLYIVNGQTLEAPAELLYLQTRSPFWFEPERKPEIVCLSSGGINYKWYSKDNLYYLYQYLDGGSIVGSTITFKMYCLPNSWAQLYVSSNGGATYVKEGTPVFKSVAENGVSVTKAAGTYLYKFYLYNNNCNYGYSNVRTIVIP